MSRMRTKNLSHLKIFTVSNETTSLLVVGSLSKSDKHFQLIFGIFYNFACRCKKLFLSTRVGDWALAVNCVVAVFTHAKAVG